MILLFAHGWGFDRSLWEPLAALLPEWEHAFDDRGYFGRPATPHVDGPCWAITHSLGTMRVLRDPPAGLVGVVAINGFSRFAVSEAGPGVPRRVIARMLSAFQVDPARVLATFRAECGVDGDFPPIDATLLRQDLMVLRDGNATPPAVPMLSLEGARDQLLTADTRAAQFPRADVRRLVHPDGGHLLPIEAPEWCAQAIRAALPA